MVDWICDYQSRVEQLPVRSQVISLSESRCPQAQSHDRRSQNRRSGLHAPHTCTGSRLRGATESQEHRSAATCKRDAAPLSGACTQVQPGYLAPRMPAAAPEQGEGWDSIMQDLEEHIMPGANTTILQSNSLNTLVSGWIMEPSV